MYNCLLNFQLRLNINNNNKNVVQRKFNYLMDIKGSMKTLSMYILSPSFSNISPNIFQYGSYMIFFTIDQVNWLLGNFKDRTDSA